MTKQFFLSAVLFCVINTSFGQSVLLHENFEAPSGADSVTAFTSGTQNWAINTTYAVSGTQSIHKELTLNDSAALVTMTFSTVGYQFVFLSFAHICKVHYTDAAEIYVSNNNGTNWVKVTGAQYLGSGFFANYNSVFASLTYIDWQPSNDAAIPTNSWWKQESFDLSTLVAQAAQVKVMFLLRDLGGQGANGNYGWLIDDINISAAVSELVPPVIGFTPPLLPDTIYSNGPFTVNAAIADASGIDTAYLVYTVNGGTPDTLGMTNVSGYIYTATMPSQTYNSLICYKIVAFDASVAQNTASLPSIGCKNLLVLKGTTTVTVGTGVFQNATTTYPAPYGNRYWGARHQFFILAEELHSAGLSAGHILSLGFDVVTAQGTALQGFSIKMGQTSQNALTTSFVSSLSTVYSVSSYTESSGWSNHVFQTPFFWNGVDNILVETCFNNTTSSNNAIVRQSTTSYSSSLYMRDNLGGICQKPTGTTVLQRPNMRFTVPPTNFTYDAGISHILLPALVNTGAGTSLKVRVKNYGSDTLTKATVYYSVNNGATQGPVIWNGNMLPGVTSDSLSLGSINLHIGYNTIKVWTTLPNDSVDQNTVNDALTITVFSCPSTLSGNYSIGGAGADFPSISDAVESMLNCGLSGPVVFNLAPGTYAGQFTFPFIPTASASNTITFRSATGNKNDVILLLSTAGNDNFTVRFNGASYYTLKQVTVRSNDPTLGQVIVIEGNSRNVTIDSCNVIAPLSTDFTVAGIYSPAASTDYNTTISNCTIFGGGYGIRYTGAVATVKKRFNVINNVIEEYYSNGIFSSYTDSLNIISNVITNRIVSGSSYGMNIQNTNGYGVISKNKIHLQGNGGQGIYIGSKQASPEFLTISNNFITQANGTNATSGISLSGSFYVNVYFNSVNITAGSTSEGRAFNHTTGGSIRVINNIFSNTGGGYAYYVNTPAAITASNYNTLRSSGTNLAYWTANRSNLAALQAASGMDANSNSIIPPFTSPLNLYLNSSALSMLATYLTDVTDDINGNPRTPNPTIGAHEIPFIPNDAGVISFLYPTPSTVINQNDVVSPGVIIKNLGSSTITSMTVAYTINNGPPIFTVYTGPLLPSVIDTLGLPSFTSPAGSTLITAYTILTGDSNTFNDTCYFTYNGVHLIDARLSRIIPIADGCGLGLDTIEIVIANLSVSSSLSNFLASYSLSGSSTVVTETVTASIPAGDSLKYTFNTPANFAVTGADQTFVVKAWISVVGDDVPLNDSSTMNVVSKHIPNPPTVSNTSIPYGTSVTIPAPSPNNNVLWYISNTAATPFATTQNYTTPLLYNTTTYWVEATTTIGSAGTFTAGTATTSGNLSGPIYTSDASSSYLWSDHISIIDASDLANTVGYVSSLSWNKTNSGAYTGGNAEFKIYLKHTNSSSISTSAGTFATQVAGATLVYQSTTQSISSSTGWKEFVFNTTNKFLYNGSSRLMVLVQWYRPGNANGEMEWAFTAVSGKAQTWADDSYPPASNSGSGQRPNVRVKFVPFVGCTSTRVPVTVTVAPPPANDAGVYDFVSPGASVMDGTSTNIEVRIRNYGTNDLTSVDVYHKIDGVTSGPTPLTFIPPLPKDSISPPIILAVGIYSLGSHTLDAWTSLPNGVVDSANMNDTIHHNFSVCMGGNYTLGTPTSDFPTFASALSALSTYPICTHVVFNVEPGIYTQQLNLTAIAGVGPNTTVTFQSASGDSTDVVVRFEATGTANNRVVRLEGAKYFTFRKMTFHATGTNYGIVFDIINDANYNTISNCVIRTSNTSGGTDFRGITTDANLPPCNHIVISNNLFIGGYYGIFWMGNINPPGLIKNHITIANNSIEDYYYAGLFIRYTDSLYVHSNVIKNRPGNAGIYGIYLNFLQGFGEVFNNRVHVHAASTQFAAILVQEKSSNSTKYLTIANNFIINSGSSGTARGIYLTQAYYVNVYYNSINTTGGDAANGRCIDVASGSNIRIKNNILVNSGGGYTYYVSSASAITLSDYNDFYATGPNIAYWGGAARSNLAALQAASGRDVNSISVNPVFNSPTNLYPSASALYQGGNPIAGITTDIFGTLRPATLPCIGAVEFIPVYYDAGLISISSPVSPVTGTDSLRVTLVNGGVNTLTSVTINWQVNGQTQTPLNWTGSLLTNTTLANVTVGGYLFAGGSYDIKVWTSQPNSQPDGFAGNDTLKTNVIACSGYMRGVYTIGGPGADFSNFNAAVNALKHCGVDSATVFLVTTGTYNENIEIPQINGASALNTITFRSATGDSTDVVVEYSATGIQLGYVVSLNGAKYIHFKNMTLSSLGVISGKTVILKNGANYNLFEGCIISTPLTTLTTFFCVYSDNASADQHNVFRGNRILNGYYGFYIIGSNTNRKKGFVIENNEISGYYYYGISTQYTDSILILNNRLRTVLPATIAYHLQVYYPRGYVKISKNNIYSTTFSNASGIMVGFADTNYTTPMEVSNNFIAQVGSSTSFRGIGIYGVNTRVNLLNNSVNVTSVNTSAYCVYASDVHSIRMFNNSFANPGGGHPVYISDVSGNTIIAESDNNNYYTIGGYFIKYGISYSSLTAYQVATGLDTNSIISNPLYNSTQDLHTASPLLNGAGIPLMEITDDIDGDLRDPVNPDIGADEFDLFLTDIGPTEILSPSFSNLNAGANVTVEVRVKNLGSTNVNTFNIGYIYAGQAPVNAVWNGLLGIGQTLDYSFTLPFTLLSGLHELLIFTSMTGDMNINNDTIQKSVKGQGIFTPAWSDSFDNLPDHWYTPGNLWERGVPTASTINTAYSTPNVWATDLSGAYPIGQEEFLYTPYFNFSTVSGATLKFYHWRDFADIGDFGQVQMSTTGGSTWFTLGYMGDPAGTNWYTNAAGGQHFFSGNSSGWAQSTYDLSAYNNFATPIQFRFRFISNTSGVSDGWAIDNFEISIPPVVTDGGVSAILSPGSTTSIQNPVSVQVRIMNYGVVPLTNIPVRYQVNSLAPVSETWIGTLAPGNSVDYSFTTTYSSPSTNYKLCAFTVIAGDQNILNDTTCKNIVPYSTLDIGVSRIVSPLNFDTTYTNHPNYDVTVMVKNYGTDPVSAFQVLYTLNGVVQATEPWTGLLNPNDSVSFTFATGFLSLSGSYNLCARTILTGDLVPANDESCVQLYGTIAIGELSGNPLTLQNHPNPAKESTLIEFSIPRPGKVVFEMHNFLGQPLIVEQIEVMGESYQMEVDLRSLAAGIYTYSIRFEEYRMVRKMIVMK